MTGVGPLRVLIVEDEPVARAAHAEYLRRLGGYEVVRTVASGIDALRALRGGGIDLVFLDMNLPDGHGIELCRRVRAEGIDVDVIAITAARELSVVRAAISAGVVQYLIKPFGFATFAEKLGAYSAYRRSTEGSGVVVSQREVDLTLATLRQPPRRPALAKGLAEDTLRAVASRLAEAGAASAAELAESSGLSRVTARRYLEHLAEIGQAARRSRHGGHGRPEIEYVWPGG